jgi:taurine dioxygenase
MPDTKPDFRPLTGAFGAEVIGVDLSQEIPDALADRLLQAFRESDLLLFRDQKISAADQSRFAAVFGEIAIRTSHYEGVAQPEFADQQHVSNRRADGILGDGELTLHADHLWTPEPLNALMLYGIEVPETGGETRFCASGHAFAAMPEELRRTMDGLRCVHMYDFRKSDYTAPYDLSRRGQPNVADATHPMVWTDPASGRRAIWYNRTTTAAIEGIGGEEVPGLVARLRRHLDDLAINYVHHWRAGDLLVWNNRMLLHARAPFDPSQPRTLRRTPIRAAA